VRLDTEPLDQEIARRQRLLNEADKELERLDGMARLLTEQDESARHKADAELAHAKREAEQARQRWQVELRQAETEAESTSAEEAHLRTLGADGPELKQATLRAKQAQTRLAVAKLPPDEGRVELLKRSQELEARERTV